MTVRHAFACQASRTVGQRCVVPAWLGFNHGSAFFLMATAEQPSILKITWLTDNPVWVEQWSMTETRLQLANQLIQEQLDAGHIRPSVSLWNTPIFVIPKKSGEWRLLHDLRKVNEQMQTMGALQPGLPAPTMIPQGWSIIVIDLKDCFFTILLHPQDTQRFAFTVPPINRVAPTKRYEWIVLPQGMRNSPCWLITDAQICPEKVNLHDSTTTLHDAQKLLGDLQWVRTIIGITNDDLLPFLPWLQGSDANSSRVCTPEQQKTLMHPKCQVMTRTDAFAALIRKGRDRIVEINGKEPADISIPVKDEDLEWLLRHSVALQEVLLGFAVMGVPVEIKTDNGPAYVGQRVAKFMQKWGVKHTTGIPHSPTGQAIVERVNHTLKEYLAKQKQTDDIDVVSRLSKVLFTLNYLCLAEGREEPAVVIHHHAVKEGRPQAIPGLYVYYKNMRTDAGPVWVPSRFTRACPLARIPSDRPDDNDLPGTPSDDSEPN
ncbi:hypothetical protein HGM15179_017973 [Zosterops borbonicus]|uniref:ribonuclease H n=1 Tax=Zosterops borbonicus TaxID=364589 RepID=A0A8K1FZY9_9PASS|nr:hypothetical protein HGM15179_017973 [Zosterops borbonicus]